MKKTILITGATDGIGLETAKMLFQAGHHVLLHGRSPAKLGGAERTLGALPGDGRVESHLADFAHLAQVETLADAISGRHDRLDVLINNAGVFTTPETVSPDGLDIRFAVNTIAPYWLAKRLLPLLGPSGRVVNLSSAAQSPFDPKTISRPSDLPDFEIYARSKLALTMWSRHMGLSLKGTGPVVVAVNPGSMLGSKMVKDAFGVAGGDLRVGADILVRAALSDEFAAASGEYFDNDRGQFAAPHADALDPGKCEEVVQAIEAVLATPAR